MLPACSHLEKWGVAYTYNVCHCLPYLMLRKKAIEPLGECWSEWKFFTELAGKLGMGDKFPWKTEEELIEYELEPTGLTFEELLEEKPEGAYYQQKRYGMERARFSTPTRKIEIYSDALEHIGFDPLPTYLEPERSPASSPELLGRYPLILSTGNRNMYYTHGQFRDIEALREKNPEPHAELGPETAARYGIGDGDEGHHRNKPGPGPDESPYRRARLGRRRAGTAWVAGGCKRQSAHRYPLPGADHGISGGKIAPVRDQKGIEDRD